LRAACGLQWVAVSPHPPWADDLNLAQQQASCAAQQNWPSMSALGQKQTSRHVRKMSALPPKADIAECDWNVRFVPKADIQSSISSARNIRASGTLIPSVFAVVRLITSSNLVGRKIGKSPGFGSWRGAVLPNHFRIRTPIRRVGSARAASGHAVETEMPLMKSRRRIAFPKGRDFAD